MTQPGIQRYSVSGDAGRGRVARSCGSATRVRVVPSHPSLWWGGSRSAVTLDDNDPEGAATFGHSWSTRPADVATGSGGGVRVLAAHEGRVYVSFGDSLALPGSVHVHSIDTSTSRQGDSLPVMAGTTDTRMAEIDGALYAANLYPACAGEPEGQRLAINRRGHWSVSAWIDCDRVTDLAGVPGLPGAVMVSGSRVGASSGTSSLDTWLTVDEGLTWRSLRLPVASPNALDAAGAAARLVVVGAELYAVAPQGVWRWRAIVPSAGDHAWGVGWARAVLHDHCKVLTMSGVHVGGNSQFAVWSKGPMWTFDGTAVRRMFGHLDFGQAFCTDRADGFVYAVTRGAGLVRSLNGVDWYRHPEPGVWGTRGVPATSIAVSDGTIYVGDDSPTVRAIASTRVAWRRARTT